MHLLVGVIIVGAIVVLVIPALLGLFDLIQEAAERLQWGRTRWARRALQHGTAYEQSLRQRESESNGGSRESLDE